MDMGIRDISAGGTDRTDEIHRTDGIGGTHTRGAPRRGMRLVAALALIAGTLPVGGTALAQGSAQSGAQTWEVQVGGGIGPAGAPPVYEAQAYGPSPAIIRVGDTVTWKFHGVHTVTFNSGKPDLPLVVPGPAQGELQLGPGAFPVGVAASGPTPYDGTQQVSSGAPLQGPPDQFQFSLTFTKPGLYGYVCTFHPGMRGEVEVREAGATLPETPAQANARGQATLATLAAKVRSDVQAVRPFHGAGIHAALAGLGDGFGASALEFVHGSPSIRRGETVVWTNADPFEIHTVTFTGGAQAPDFVQPRPQAGGPPALVIPANIAGPVGGDTYTGQGYANSGIIGAGGSHALRFDAPAGTYEYLCLVHPWMRGAVTVTG